MHAFLRDYDHMHDARDGFGTSVIGTLAEITSDGFTYNFFYCQSLW